MMMNDVPMGHMIFGLPLEVFLMLASGIFYLICALLIWKPFREEKNELIGALFAFLVYQAISMFFMGLEMNTMNLIFSNISSLAVFIGSLYMLKFPFSSYSQSTRRILFMSSLIILLVVFGFFMTSTQRQMNLMNFTIWYDIVINGVFVGLFMLIIGLKASQPWLKIKALGGGTGIASCCVVSNVAMIGGFLLVGTVFQFLAPIVILVSLIIGRIQQKNTPGETQQPVTV